VTALSLGDFVVAEAWLLLLFLVTFGAALAIVLVAGARACWRRP